MSYTSPNPGAGFSSATPSDDEISVIAVIKKGTSGIPKRARYHYIRELPLTSVKSLKKGLEKPKETTPTVKEVPSPRVIDLSDENSKMELHRQFKMADDCSGEEGDPSGSGGMSPFHADGIVHKLPPGTVLIKQEVNNPGIQRPDDMNNEVDTTTPGSREGSNTVNGSTASETTTPTNTVTGSSSSNNSSESTSTSSVSSCGSGSSSGGLGSGTPSPSEKVKRLHRPSRGAGVKTNHNVVPRRNPARCGVKKGVATTGTRIPTNSTTTTSAMTTRPRQRQRLLATRRQEANESAIVSSATNRRTKLNTMPYMNTRSVTRKLYTVGATYQAPTLKDETEWREWPVHGMHERPVYHPQVGLASEYLGRVFWTSTGSEGSNLTYREVVNEPEEVEVVRVDPGLTQRKRKSINEPVRPQKKSFEVCMHESLHFVLAYCAQVMSPRYRRAVAKKRRRDSDPGPQAVVDAGVGGVGVGPLNLTELEDSSISDETLMEMSSIYKKLLPTEDEPPLSPMDLSSPSQADKTLQKTNGPRVPSTSKNGSEASEIARILSEYNEGLKTQNIRTPKIPEVRDEESNSGQKGDEDKYHEKWLEELLVDTSLLYCAANGVAQRDLSHYVDSLDSSQSLQWLRRRDADW